MKRKICRFCAIVLLCIFLINSQHWSFTIAHASDYNASSAVEYARRWSRTESKKASLVPNRVRNPEYNDYTTQGGDCANFVSQCLLAGGLQMDSTWRKYSSAWNYASGLKDYLVDTKGYAGNDNPHISDLAPGDPVWVPGEGNAPYGHVMIVSEVSDDSFWVCGHTWDYRDKEYDINRLTYHVSLHGGIIPEPDEIPFETPLVCYTVSTGDVYTYNIAGEHQGHISGSADECTIVKVFKNNMVKVIYPVDGGGTRPGYVSLSEFIGSDTAVERYVYKVNATTTVYRRSDLSQYLGEVYPSDNITVVGESNGRLQIIYPLDGGGFKLGWISGKRPPNPDPVPVPDPVVSIDTRYPTPIKSYTNASDRVTTFSAVNGGNTGWIGTGDLCTIKEVYINGWCLVNYPLDNGGDRDAYTQFSNFLDTGSQITPQSYRPSRTLEVYQRKNLSAKLGSVWSSDPCIKVASANNDTLLQIIYPLDAGGYKMGWVSDVNKPIIDWPQPFICYTNRNETIGVYDAGHNDMYGEIWVDDECTVNAVYTDGWLSVTYPTGSGPKDAFEPVSEFIPNLVTKYKVTSPTTIPTYRKSDMASTYGHTDPGDECVVVGKTGDRLAIIYPIPSGYKLGWVYASAFKVSLTDITIDAKPNKLTYTEGESLNTSGMRVVAHYSDNSSKTVTPSVSGYNSTPGEKNITVSYSEGGITKTTTFSVTVNKKKPTKLAVTKQPSRTSYVVGMTSFDFTDMVVTCTYDNGTSAVVNNYELMGMDGSVGKKVITVQYTESDVTVKATFEIVVNDRTLVALLLSEDETDYVLEYGSEFDRSAVTVTARYNNGDLETIKDYEVKQFDPTQVGEQEVSLTYKGASATAVVRVLPKASSFTYALVNGRARITGYDGTEAIITIPSQIDDYPVSEIGDQAFKDNTRLSEITLSTGIEQIGAMAFSGCSNLKTVNLPDGLKKLGRDCFFESGLCQVRIPATTTSIVGNPFAGCNVLTAIEVASGSSSYTVIDHALCTYNGRKLIAVPGGAADAHYAVPEGITIIGSACFRANDSLREVVIPESVSFIEDDAFEGCSGLTICGKQGSAAINFAIENGFAYVCTDSVMTDPSMILPEALKQIDDEAFRGCKADWIRLSENVERIGNYAFADCPNLSQIYIPEATFFISTTAFQGVASDIKIYGVRDSYAEYYASKHHLTFVAVE